MQDSGFDFNPYEKKEVMKQKKLREIAEAMKLKEEKANNKNSIYVKKYV